MICPNCGDLIGVNDKGMYFCDECYGEFPYLDRLIDPAELLRLIEAAIKRSKPYHSSCVSREERDRWIKAHIFDATKAALSGDPEPLKKLGGEE